MWEKLKSIAQHPAAKALKTFCGDPVQLYSVFLVMTAMHYYHQEWTWLYTLLTLGISFVLIRFYDFVAKRKLIGPVCYLIFLGLGLYVVSLITHLGEHSYPLSFFVWFLTPQGVVDFSLIYTIAIYLLMTGFFTSAVYYFAKVRYRMVMQLVIMLIPLSLYAKEGLHMPALLVILLLSSYFLLMVYCRQLRENEEVRLMDGFHSGVSIALYVAAFSVIAAIIPKPQFEADREFIDNAMSYSTWSDTLMNAISMFTNKTTNSISVSNNARTLYYAYAPESLRLRTQTYTYYLDDDSWNAVTSYDKPDQVYAEPLTYQPRALTQAILDAAAADDAFAETYGLTDVRDMDLPPQNLQRAAFFPLWYNVTALPTPTRTSGLKIDNDHITRSATDTVSLMLQQDGAEVYYYSDTYARYEAESAVLNRLQNATYADLLRDAEQILRSRDSAAADLVQQAAREFQAAEQLLQTAEKNDFHSDVIDRLAAEITKDRYSDLEKALSIEQYFSDAGYVYDLAYQKAEGENIVDFLTVSHTGVCYEYATAMTLLCRSAGLPTRYVQGFNLGERYEKGLSIQNSRGNQTDVNFVIKMRDAHAFPEVYISGYGWVSFEPTVASAEGERNSTAENLNVARWGYVLLGLTLIAIGIWMLLPRIRERQFRRRLPGMEASAAASAVFRQMRTTLHMEDSATVQELQKMSLPFFGEETVFAEIDKLLYDPAHRSEMHSQQLAETYIRWQAQYKVYEKEVKKLRKEQKKNHVHA